MVGVSLMPVFTITWNSHLDARTCKVCYFLNGKTWIMTADELPAIISHPHYGDVYDLRIDQSLAHGHGPWHCRCGLSIEVDDPELTADLEEISHKTTRLNSTLEESLRSVQQFLSLLERVR